MFLCFVAVTLSVECRPALAIYGRQRILMGITSGFYGPMDVHRGTVISAIVTLYLFFCILHLNA